MSRTLLFALLLSAINSHAQIMEEKNYKRFGFQAGANTADMNFNLGSTAPDQPIENIWNTGITFGFFLSVPLTDKLTIQPEFSFTHRNGSDESLKTDYSFNYLSIPVLLSYQISPKFYVMAGPQVELLIDAKSIYQGTSTTITHQVEERSIGFAGGLEYDFINSFFLNARYFQGTNNIGIYQRSDVKEFKFQVITFTAGIKF